MSHTLLPEFVETIGKLVPPVETHAQEYGKKGFHYEIIVSEIHIRKVALNLQQQNFFLECLSATDFSDCFELFYIFNHWTLHSRIVVKVIIPKTQDEATSILNIFPSADWYEKEIFDMYGLKFRDHPKLKRLLLPESSTIHPLLKSFKGEPEGSDVKQVMQLLEEDKKGFEVVYPRTTSKFRDTYRINIGPQHPSTHGVLRVVLDLKGERVINANPVIGYVHRNHEKMAEIQEYKAFWPNIGRLDYVGAMSYNFCYAGLIERAMEIQPTERTEYIRVVLTELNRISSHLLWLGTYLLDLGAFTPFFYCFDDREKILDILEHVTGERLTYDYFRFGGLDHDIPQDIVVSKIKEFIPHFKNRLKDYQKLVGNNIIFRKRTEGVGFISRDVALQYGITGPALRACGVRHDLRRDEPYSIYPNLDFNIPTRDESDAYARYQVRMAEMTESLKIVEQIYQSIPDGDYKIAKLPRFVPKGEYYFSVESARGSFGIYLVSDGTMQPYKMKLRTPSFANLSGFNEYAKGCFLADMISVLGSMDIVIPEIDR